MPTLEERVYANERDIKKIYETDIKNIYDRLGKVEDKSSGAWKTIGEQRSELSQVKQEISDLRTDIGALNDRIGGLEVDMKEQKIASKDNKRMLKAIIILLAVYGVIAVGFFIYIWRHDADLAKGLLTLGITVGGAIA